MRTAMFIARINRLSAPRALLPLLLAGTALGGLAFPTAARADEQLAAFLPVGQIAAVDLSNDLSSDAISCLGGPSLNTCLVNGCQTGSCQRHLARQSDQ